MLRFSGWMAVFALLIAWTDAAAQSESSASARIVSSFDLDWRFFRADAADDVKGAENPDFDDSAWRKLNVPHDWGIEGPFDEKNPTRGSGGFLPAGVGWYRKHFTLPAEYANRRVFIEFDGVMANSDVWLNGRHLGKRPYGYVGFGYEMSGELKFGKGKDNVLVVRADNSAQPASRWYSGAGIYRHVRIVTVNPVHVEKWSTFITTSKIESDRATVHIQTTVVNQSDVQGEVSAQVDIVDPDGKTVQGPESESRIIRAGGSADFGHDIIVKNPKLWGDCPDLRVGENGTVPFGRLQFPLYRAIVKVRSGGAVLDDEIVSFGIRDFKFEPETGFWLNGRNFKIKGVCLHHDGGAVGAAVPLGVWQRRLETLKRIGVNAIRTAHNPPAPEFLDLCDQMGFLVMDEFFDCWTVGKNRYDYHLYFDEWSKTDARDTIRRDRNHPGVILYSVGNEIHDTPKAELAKGILKGLVDVCHEHDPTRPATQALFRPNVSHDFDNGLADMLDVIGVNYRDNELLAAHRAKPARKIIGTEQVHDRKTWLTMRDNPPEAGQFLWTGIDYLGESRAWPVVAAGSGLLDLTGNPKPMAYERQSWWSDMPMVYIVRRIAADRGTAADPGFEPLNRRQTQFHDWTPQDASRHDETVEVYSNCDDVELVLNGKSLGSKSRPADDSPRSWTVAFEPGDIKAFGKDKDRLAATDELKTAGKPAKIALAADRETLAPNWDDVCFVTASITDENGVPSPNADNLIKFKISGPGVIAAVDNGDRSSREPFQSAQRRAIQGRCIAVLKAAGTSGKIELTASAPGLAESSINIETSAPAERKTSFKFDFGPGRAEPGYIQVLPTTVYSKNLGYGFDLDSKVSGVDRGGDDALRGDFCTSDRPFYFSVALPEGNYNVTAVLGDKSDATNTTVKAESRRLMLEKTTTEPGKFAVRTFTVNVRGPTIAGDKAVRLKPREKGPPLAIHWDDKLTLEFNGPRPCVCALEISKADDAVTLYLAGDSTVTDQPQEPWNSWGQMLPGFFKSGLAVANHAESGETLKGFIDERRLDKILGTIKPGDYLFIQFGHNDMKDKSPGAGAFTTYRDNLKRFIGEARKRGANPVLVTPMHRLKFDADGKVENTLGDYPEAVRRTAKEENVPLIDLGAMSKAFYEALGPQNAKKAFVDGTHHNNYGSYELAKCVVEGIRANNLGIVKFLAEDVPAFDPGRPDAVEKFDIPASPAAATDKTEQADEINELQRNFEQPPDDARIMMRWWWFGPAVSKPELQREMELMKQGGIGGFEVQPTYPLSLDDEKTGVKNFKFLSAEFFDALNFTAGKAKELGLRMDLTLGSGWPYGGPQFPPGEAAGRLRIANARIAAGQSSVSLPRTGEGEKIIAAFIGPVPNVPAGENPYKEIEIRGNAVRVPGDYDGQNQITFFIAGRTNMKVKRAAYGAEGLVIDHYNPAVIDKFIKEIAEPEVKACGANPPYAVFCDSLEVVGEDWTDNFLEEFLRRRGYDLRPHLPALFRDIGPKTADVRCDWGKTLTEMFNDYFITAFEKWAKRNGTKFRVQGYGTPPAALYSYAYADLCEGEGHAWKDFKETRWASSAGHLLGRPITSSEAWTWLHSPVFRATPLDMKAEADRHFLQGVNQLIGHGWPYLPPGAEYPGWRFYAAGAFNEKNPWWIVMPDVARYLQRVSFMTRQGRPANDVAIYISNSDAWASFSPGRVSINNAVSRRLGPEIIRRILESGYNLDFFDDGLLEMRGKAERGALAFGDLKYKVVVLPGVERIPPSTFRKLEQFAAGGGILVATRSIPSLAPGFKAAEEDQKTVRDIGQRLFKDKNAPGIFLESDAGVGEALAKRQTPDVKFSPAAPEIGFVHRATESGEIYFLANAGNTPKQVKTAFRIVGMNPEQWDPLTGRIAAAEIIERTDGGTSINLDLAPYESRFIVFTNRKLPARGAGEKTAFMPPPIDLSEGWIVTFGKESNAAAMDKLRCWTEDERTRYFSGVAVYEKKFSVPADMLKDNLALQIKFGGQLKAKVQTGGDEYGMPADTGKQSEPQSDAAEGTKVQTKPGPGMWAILDTPVREAAVVYVNGKRAGAVWCPPYCVDVTVLLRGGENYIRIEVANLAINYMADTKKHPLPDYSALIARFGDRFQAQDMDKIRPVPSGLLGPIRLIVTDKTSP
jgi:beta-galactosidase